MIPYKSKITKFKSEAFHFIERFGTGIYMILFSKTIISLLGNKNHRYPTIAGVTRNLFRATAIFYIQIFCVPIAPLKGTPQWCAACDKDMK